MKCIRIHIDRNHIRPLIEKSFIPATDMHEGFKVQLVVEFYIYPLCLGRSHKYCRKHLSRRIRRCPFDSIVSLLGKKKAVQVCWSWLSGSTDPPLLCPFGSRVTVLLPRLGFKSFLWLKSGEKTWSHFRKGAAGVWSTSFHISPEKRWVTRVNKHGDSHISHVQPGLKIFSTSFSGLSQMGKRGWSLDIFLI